MIALLFSLLYWTVNSRDLKISGWSTPKCLGDPTYVDSFINTTIRCENVKNSATYSYIKYDCNGVQFYKNLIDCKSSQNAIIVRKQYIQNPTIINGVSVTITNANGCLSISLKLINEDATGLSFKSSCSDVTGSGGSSSISKSIIYRWIISSVLLNLIIIMI